MDRNDFTKMMLALSIGVKKWAPDFSDVTTINVWYAALKDCDETALRLTCRNVLTTHDEFPSIAQFLRLTTGCVMSDEEIGQDIAGRIEESISRFGFYNSEQARKSIGELGWKVVEKSGGWEQICEGTTNDMLPSCRKQWRELAAMLHKKFYLQGSNEAPALPQSNSVKELLASVKLGSVPK